MVAPSRQRLITARPPALNVVPPPPEPPPEARSIPDAPRSAAASATVVVGALTFVAIGFAARVVALDQQSLWYDEGLTAFYATMPLAEMAARLRDDEHPPLYFWLLQSWISFAGSSDFSLRWLSVAAGVIAIALISTLARHSIGAGAAVLAPLLLAVSPFHLWYSQEVRNYAALTAATLAAVVVFGRAWTAPKPAPWLISLAVVNAVGLWTHYQFALIGVAEVGWLLIWLAWPSPTRPFPIRRRRAALVALALIVGGLTMAPWLSATLAALRESDTYWPGQIAASEVVTSSALAWWLGDRVFAPVGAADPAWVSAAWLFVVAIAGLGSLTLFVARRRLALTTFAAAVAIVCLVIVWLVVDRPKFAPRYLLLVTPFILLLAASFFAAAWDRRHAGWVRLAAGGFLLVWLVGAAGAAVAQSTTQAYWREDYRDAARFLEREATADDAIVLVSGHAQVVFNHYYRGDARVIAAPPETVPHLRRAVRWENLNDLNATVADRRRVWLLEWQANVLDPSDLIRQQLALAGRRADPGQAFHGLHLARFDFDSTPTFPLAAAPSREVGARFGQALELVGYDIAPGHWAFNVTLYWRVHAPIGSDYTAFIHLLSPREYTYGGVDRPPVNAVYPTSRWQVGEYLRDSYEAPVARNAPPGVYAVEVGLYDAQTRQRLPITGADGAPVGDRLLLEPVAIGPEHVARPPQPERELVPPLELTPNLAVIGWDLPAGGWSSGATVEITSYWFATGALPFGYQIGLALRDSTGATVVMDVGPPADGLFPSDRWGTNDTVRDIRRLTLPPAPPSGARLAAVAIDPSGLVREVDLGPVTIR